MMTLAEGLLRKAKRLFGEFTRHCKRMQRRVAKAIDRDSDAGLFIRLEKLLKSDPEGWLEPYASVQTFEEYFERRKHDHDVCIFMKEYMDDYVRNEYCTLARALLLMLDEEMDSAFRHIRKYNGKDAEKLRLKCLAKTRGVQVGTDKDVDREVFRRMDVDGNEFFRVLEQLRMLIRFMDDKR